MTTNIRVDRITAHPTLPFYVIINPQSGPVPTPDSNYQACIPRLKASSSVTVVGYVPTGFGTASIDTVNSDTAEYAAWGSAYRPQGIFFDEVSPTAGFLSKYTNWTSTAKARFNSGNGYVRSTLLMCRMLLTDLIDKIILNPGTSVGSETAYFTLANQIVTAENFYNDFRYIIIFRKV